MVIRQLAPPTQITLHDSNLFVDYQGIARYSEERERGWVMNQFPGLVARMQSKQSLVNAGVVVIDGRIPRVLHRPRQEGNRLYVTLYRLDESVKHCCLQRFRDKVQVQFMKLGVRLGAMTFAGTIGGQYACFVAQTASAQGPSGAFGELGANASGGDSSEQMMQATQELQELNMSFNLQYLALQQHMQSENRQFTAISNIMKTKHDTAKNAINNVR